MWDYRALSRIDFRIVLITLGLMTIGLLVISSMTSVEGDGDMFWTPAAKSQLRWICLSWLVFGLAVGFDYRKLRSWSIALYIIVLLLLAGLFFVPSIQNVHRWYRLFGVISLQPSEQAKLILVICLSWFLERKGKKIGTLFTALQTALLVGVPFFLVFKTA